MEKDFDNNNENCIEFLSGERSAVVSFTNKKHINRIKKLYEERKDDFKYFHENTDGSICAKLPLKWIKISPTKRNSRIYTEEEKIKNAERLKNSRRNKNICQQELTEKEK